MIFFVERKNSSAVHFWYPISAVLLLPTSAEGTPLTRSASSFTRAPRLADETSKIELAELESRACPRQGAHLRAATIWAAI